VASIIKSTTRCSDFYVVIVLNFEEFVLTFEGFWSGIPDPVEWMEKHYLKHKHGAVTLARMPAAQGAAHPSRSRQRQKLVSPTRGPLGSGEGRLGGSSRGAKRKMAAAQTAQLWQMRKNPV
jgi:hypothetical protein